MQQRSGAASLDDSPAAVLYERYATTVFTYLRRRLPTREDAEDVLLEVFLAAFERNSLSGLAEHERSAWLQQVARNKLSDYYRRARRRSTVGLDEATESLYDERFDPERLALQHEDERRLRAAIRQMPPFQQELLRLRFGLDLRCTQIADRLGKGESAIRMALLRTLNLLRSLYEER